MAKKILQTQVGVIVLILGILASITALYFAHLETSSLLQTILYLVSIVLVFFCAHPIAHFLFARSAGVRVEYFFIGKSDFRKLNIGVLKPVGNLLLTMGTKLDASSLRNASRLWRSWIYGSGSIVGVVILFLEALVPAWLGFGLIDWILGWLIFVLNLITQLLFSTKVGDLSKMRRELSSK